MQQRRIRAVLALALPLGLLAACAPRPVYNPTPTAGPAIYVAAPPTATPEVAPTATPTMTPVVSGPMTVRIEPAVVELAAGETRSMKVQLDNADGLHSIELHIGFEPTYVHVEDADAEAEGVQVEVGTIPGPEQVVRNEVDNEAGFIIYEVAQAPGSTASGSGIAASFTLRALAEGGSPLRFNVVNLCDTEGEMLTVPRRIDGLVIIEGGSAAIVPTTEVAPTGSPPAQTPSGAIPSTGTPLAATPVPSPVPVPPATQSGIYHTVQQGENMFRIARRYGITVDDIAAANDLADPGTVQAGQVLLIPISPPVGTVAYIVQPGDTLYSLARRFDMTVERLAQINGVGPSYEIKTGRPLIIVP